MIATILAILFFIISLTLGYVVFNLNKKLHLAEEWIEGFIMKVLNVQEELRNVDQNGAFEADDEVGFVFVAIQQIIDVFAHLVTHDEQPVDEPIED